MDTPHVPGMGGVAVRRPPSQRGQTLAVIAVMMVALIAFLGLAIDGGNVYAQRRQMQNAADAGALAGAREWARSKGTDEDAARARIREYAVDRNGAQDCSATFEDTHVTVTATKDVPTYFVRVIGIATMPVAAQARAGVYKVIKPACGFLPLTIPDRPTWPEGSFTIWDKATSTEVGLDVSPQEHGWLNLDGVLDKNLSDSELNCWVSCPPEYVCKQADKNPNPGLEADDVVNGDPGARSNPLQTIEDCWVDRVVLIPVYDYRCPPGYPGQTKPDILPAEPCWDNSLGAGQYNYHIVGFIPFHIEAVSPNGTEWYIRGHVESGYDISTECVKESTPGFSDISAVRLEPLTH